MSSHISFQERYTTRQNYTPVYVEYDFGRGLKNGVYRGGCIIFKDTYLRYENSFDTAVNTIQAGCIVYPNVLLGTNIKIGHCVILKDGVNIDNNATIGNSVVIDDCVVVEEGVSIFDGCIIEKYVCIGKDSTINEGCTLGAFSQVLEKSCLPCGTVVAPYTTVTSYGLYVDTLDPQSNLTKTMFVYLLRSTSINADTNAPPITEQWSVQDIFSGLTGKEVNEQYPEFSEHIAEHAIPKHVAKHAVPKHVVSKMKPVA